MCKGLPFRYVSANSLLFFSEKTSSDFRADVLTCGLYTQMTASDKHSAFEEVTEWRHRYLQALTSFRCVISYRANQTFSLEAGETIWSCLVSKLGTRVSSSMLEAAEATFRQISLNTDPAGLTLLAEHAVRKLCDEPPTCEVVLQLGFSEAAPVTTLAFLSFKSTLAVAGLPLAALLTEDNISGAVNLSIISFELDGHDFGYFRERMIQKLGSKRDELIIKIAQVES